MARTAGTSARTQRLIALASTCLLGAVTAFAIGRVFLGHPATYRLLVAALASALLACALERRNLLVATAASAAALLVAIGLLIFPATTWHGLPTLETLHAIGHAAGLVGEQARVQVAPSLALPPLLLAALTATWAAVFSAHALAFRAGSPLLALLPPIALVAFADTVLDQWVKPLYGVAFLAAALLVIFADGLRRLQGWGPVWTGPGRDAQLTRTAGRGARRVAFACLGIALIAPALMPGFGSKAILDFSTNGDGPVTLDPFVNIAGQLNASEERPVFTVHTKQPTYYRMVALPTYADAGWSVAQDPATQEVGPGEIAAPGTISPTVVESADRLDQTFQTDNEIALPWLPVAYPVADTTLNQTIHLDAEASTLGLEQPLGPDTTYETTSLRIEPTREELRALGFVNSDRYASYTSLPDATQAEVARLAGRWRNGADNEYDSVMNVLGHFTDGTFGYDTTVPRRDSSTALMTFLKRTKVGYCQQFAGAMAVILRALGIPARVAVGYTGGKLVSDDTYQVTTQDAHAWVEVLFPTYGWLTFDPTPGAADSFREPYADPSAGSTCEGTECVNPGGGHRGSKVAPNSRTMNPQQDPLSARATGSSFPVPDVSAPRPTITGKRLLLGALALALLILLLIPPARAWRRRRRLHRAADEPRSLILATYDVFTERAAELGFPRGSGETLEEYRRRLGASGRLSDGHLDRLTRIASSAAYAPEEPDAEASRAAGEAAATTLRDLRRSAPWAQRLLGHYRREG
jgi:transglutaminase-like putative cysteine protease